MVDLLWYSTGMSLKGS